MDQQSFVPNALSAFGIKVWRDYERNTILWEAPSASVPMLTEALDRRIERLFSTADWRPLQPQVPARSEYGTCAICLEPMAPHCAGPCLICVVAEKKARASDADRRLIFLDTETTARNAKRCGIIEIAAVTTTLTGDVLDQYHSRVRLEEARHRYLVEPEALVVNGYRAAPHLWRDAPTLEAVMGDVASRVRPQDCIIAYNASYDQNALNFNMELACVTNWRPQQRIFDAMKLAHPLKAAGKIEDKKLITVAKFLGIQHDAAHTALGDTLALKEAFFRLTATPTETP